MNDSDKKDIIALEEFMEDCIASNSGILRGDPDDFKFYFQMPEMTEDERCRMTCPSLIHGHYLDCPYHKGR